MLMFGLTLVIMMFKFCKGYVAKGYVGVEDKV